MFDQKKRILTLYLIDVECYFVKDIFTKKIENTYFQTIFIAFQTLSSTKLRVDDSAFQTYMAGSHCLWALFCCKIPLNNPFSNQSSNLLSLHLLTMLIVERIYIT